MAPAPWDVPTPLPPPVRTPRLVVRFYERGDAASLHRAVDRDRQALLPWLPWARTGHRSEEESLAVIDRFTRRRSFVEADDFTMGIFDRSSGEVVGGTGFHRIDRDHADAEIGYWVRGDLHRKGIATEAVTGLLTPAFTDWGFRRVRVACAGANRASQRVAERVGFRHEATEVSAYWVEGAGWQDHWRYALLAHEWDPALAPPVARASAGAAAESRRDPRRSGATKGFGATDPRIPPYVERLLDPEDDVLREIRARSTAAGLPPIAVGPFDGRHLEVLARVAAARKVVEIGTLGGYSGVCLARALPPGGVLHTFEIDAHHAEVARESFRRAGVADRIRLHVGPALERLRDVEREGPFDLVFVDADKGAYPAYLDWAAEHLRIGGVVLGDNVFRRAAFTLDGEDPHLSAGIRAFNEALARGGRFRSTLLPLEDGLAVGVKVR